MAAAGKFRGIFFRRVMPVAAWTNSHPAPKGECELLRADGEPSAREPAVVIGAGGRCPRDRARRSELTGYAAVSWL